jgi:hypothetical protein
MVTAIRAMATTATRAMALTTATTWPMAMAMRLVGNEDGNHKKDGDDE